MPWRCAPPGPAGTLCYNFNPMPKEQERLHPALRQAKIFTGLPDEDVRTLASFFLIQTLEDDVFLVREGDPAQTFYILMEGQVKILQTSAEGFEVILHILGPGDIIGALPVIGEGTYPASALTLGAAQVAGIPAADFNRLLEDYPLLTRNLLRFATRVVQSSHHKIRELSTERVERRIARALSRLAGQLGRERIVIISPHRLIAIGEDLPD